MDRERLLQRLRAASSGRERTSAAGTISIGHVPVVAPLAYLHTVFNPLDDAGVRALEQELPVVIPPGFKQFLAISNGLKLFVGGLALFGHQRELSRNPTAQDWPYSIIEPNLWERPDALEPGALVIGSHRDDGCLLVMHHSRSTVVCTTPEGDRVRATWPSLESCLISEIERLHALLAPDYGRLRVGSFFRTLPGEPLPGDDEIYEDDEPDQRDAPEKPWWRFW